MNNSIQQYLSNVESERKELREDLANLPMNTRQCKVGDFGCGWGYNTWAMILEMPNSDCVGFDKFDPNEPPAIEDMFSAGKFSFETVSQQFNEFGLTQGVKRPSIQQGDIVTGKNLPTNFNLIYCKRVLLNTFMSKNGDTKVKLTIKHIANSLLSSGWFCFVEPYDSQFKSAIEEILTEENFEFETPRYVQRPYKTPGKYEIYTYLIYQCKKLSSLSS